MAPTDDAPHPARHRAQRLDMRPGAHATVTGAVVLAIPPGPGNRPGALAIVTPPLSGRAGGAMLTVLAMSNFGPSLRRAVFGRNRHFVLLGAIMVSLYCAFYASGLA